MFVGCCLPFVVARCLLFVVCCLIGGGCCWLCVACCCLLACLWFTVCRRSLFICLFVVGSSLCVVGCVLLFAVCCMVCVSCSLCFISRVLLIDAFTFVPLLVFLGYCLLFVVD